MLRVKHAKMVCAGGSESEIYYFRHLEVSELGYLEERNDGYGSFKVLMMLLGDIFLFNLWVG